MRSEIENGKLKIEKYEHAIALRFFNFQFSIVNFLGQRGAA